MEGCGKDNLNSHGARPVHLIITMIKWIRTSRLSVKNSLSGSGGDGRLAFADRTSSHGQNQTSTHAAL